MSSYDFEPCWEYITHNYEATLLDTKEYFMGQLKLMMEAAYEKGYDAGQKDVKPANSTHDSDYCEFCANHRKGDKLYQEDVSYDGALGFDYVRDIKFCPICGKELQDD